MGWGWTRKFLGAKPSLGNPWEGIVFAYGSARSDAAILVASAELRDFESDIMATLTVDGNHLVVLLSALEKMGALRGEHKRSAGLRPRGARQRHPLVGTARHPRARYRPAPGSSRSAPAGGLVSTTSPLSTAGAPRSSSR
jgi:hypothetical protein